MVEPCPSSVFDTGAQLLLLDTESLASLLGLPACRAARLARVRDAMDLFDDISVRSTQGMVSDLQLQLWLTGRGCSAREAAAATNLLKGLIVANAAAPGVTAWEWAAGWSWVRNALRAYSVAPRP